MELQQEKLELCWSYLVGKVKEGAARGLCNICLCASETMAEKQKLRDGWAQEAVAEGRRPVYEEMMCRWAMQPTIHPSFPNHIHSSCPKLNQSILHKIQSQNVAGFQSCTRSLRGVRTFRTTVTKTWFLVPSQLLPGIRLIWKVIYSKRGFSIAQATTHQYRWAMLVQPLRGYYSCLFREKTVRFDFTGLLKQGVFFSFMWLKGRQNEVFLY